MKVFIIYKDNNPTQPISIYYDKMIGSFYETDESKLEIPFDRLILNFLSSLGSFDVITDEQWEQIYKADRDYKHNLKLQSKSFNLS